MEIDEHESLAREAVRGRLARAAEGKPAPWAALLCGIADRAERAVAEYARDLFRSQGDCVVFCGWHRQP